MKNVLRILILLLLPVCISAQTATVKPSKYLPLNAKDPLIGEWEWVKDPTGSPYNPLPGVDFTYLRFSQKDSLSVGAIENNASKGLVGHCYFLARSNGEAITGTLSGCSNPAYNGKNLSFHYTVTGNELVITVKEEQFIYRRK